MLRTGAAFVLLVCCASCMFRTTRKTIRTKPITTGATVQFISEDSVQLLFDRTAYFAFLKSDSSCRNEATRLEQLFTATNSSIDSICAHTTDRDIFSKSNTFIIEQLNTGKTALTDLHTGKTIKRYKRKSCYTDPGLLNTGDRFWSSYYTPRSKTEIYFVRYKIIHF